ncbi:Protein of unknown function [Micromonospora lupini str. Lupac 08]|uniref:Uncharacterized protein n=1 Tax=Micromonospora lupini str. Lupac 08 TaxID=1150864 RepID=I0L7Q8_9ACTN|nr:Protein of unknown function [Micromonospora lupini str. Lupac 08]
METLVDGLLVGVGVTLGKSQRVILTIALTLEVMCLGSGVDRGSGSRLGEAVGVGPVGATSLGG